MGAAWVLGLVWATHVDVDDGFPREPAALVVRADDGQALGLKVEHHRQSGREPPAPLHWGALDVPSVWKIERRGHRATPAAPHVVRRTTRVDGDRAPSPWHPSTVPSLAALLAEHRLAYFPESVVKGVSYGE